MGFARDNLATRFEIHREHADGTAIPNDFYRAVDRILTDHFQRSIGRYSDCYALVAIVHDTDSRAV